MPAADAPAPINRGMITISIMLATLIQTLDSTIANVALPHMQGTLSASQDEITWVLTSYIVAAAIATPLTGWLAARYGTTQLLCASIAGFTAASVLCGISDSLAQIVAARLLQGLFGASLVPLSQSILLNINPPKKQPQAMAIWGMGVMVGPILGPTLGGWLTDSYNWRWVFFINLPIGLLALLGVMTYMPRIKTGGRTALDLFGFATLSLFIGALQAMLDRGQQKDWFNSTEIRIEAIVAVVSLVFFLIHTATAGERSFFRPELLKDRNFVTGSCFIFIIGAILYATRALLPPMLESLMGYPVATTGLVTAPSGIGTMIAMLFVGRLVGRIDVRTLLLIGVLIAGYSLYQMMGYTLVLSESDIVWPGVVQGVGLGLIFVPLSAVSFTTLKPELRAYGTSIYSLMRNIGSSIGISIVQSVVTRNSQIAHASLNEHIGRGESGWQQYFDLASAAGRESVNRIVDQQSSMIAYLDAFKFMFVATLCIVPMIFLIRSHGVHGGKDAAAHAVMD
ncbi:MAG: DHA2 family efflux MFS transporter permease subunit [Bordetella sp.]|uniref:DHA2 family efflux MFS transporter permease subunit n=1 Tax=Bordetella sp. TaxID=28081 RepID=UPI003F7CAA54